MGNKVLGPIELKPKENFMIIKQNITLMQKTEHIIPVNLSKKKLR